LLVACLSCLFLACYVLFNYFRPPTPLCFCVFSVCLHRHSLPPVPPVHRACRVFCVSIDFQPPPQRQKKCGPELTADTWHGRDLLLKTRHTTTTAGGGRRLTTGSLSASRTRHREQPWALPGDGPSGPRPPPSQTCGRPDLRCPDTGACQGSSICLFISSKLSRCARRALRCSPRSSTRAKGIARREIAGSHTHAWEWQAHACVASRLPRAEQA
jgi:hypothetical protein